MLNDEEADFIFNESVDQGCSEEEPSEPSSCLLTKLAAIFLLVLAATSAIYSLKL